MNKIIFLTVFCITTLLLLFTACKKDCRKGNCKDDPCKIDRPKDVKPIDWEGYNSVYDVFWNYKGTEKSSDMGKNIKIYGWIFQGIEDYEFDGYKFALISDKEGVFLSNFSTINSGTGIYVISYAYFVGNNENFTDSLKNKFAINDITKKCFIKGRLFYNELYTNYCKNITPMITLEDVNDIYFE